MNPVWTVSNRADPEALPLADRHYNRQKPGTPQFVPPGRCVVLLSRCRKALWVTSWPLAKYTKHEWAGAWVNTLFRNEGAGLSSRLIVEAIGVTRYFWPDVPRLGIVTFVDESEIESDNPGYCYKMAGFEHVGYTKTQQLHALQLIPDEFPEPIRPYEPQLMLFDDETDNPDRGRHDGTDKSN